MRKFFLAIALYVSILTLVSCGSSSEGQFIENGGSSAYGSLVVASEDVLTFEDFAAAGVKHGKDYNIEGLPGAIGASLGFYDARDIEIRFFPDHKTAVAQGIPVVGEVVGSDVLIKRENVTWPWGTADEKACSARVPGGGRDCTKSPKYGDFVVYGNVIMMCEAPNPVEGKA